MKRRARSSETLRPLPVRITKAEAFNGTGLALLPLAARVAGRTHHSETLTGSSDEVAILQASTTLMDFSGSFASLLKRFSQSQMFRFS